MRIATNSSCLYIYINVMITAHQIAFVEKFYGSRDYFARAYALINYYNLHYAIPEFRFYTYIIYREVFVAKIRIVIFIKRIVDFIPLVTQIRKYIQHSTFIRVFTSSVAFI